jgi:GNAT superfamily N-acetyltransferase
VADTSLIRGPRKDDQGFVANTWLKQLADSTDRDYTSGRRWGQAGVHVDAVFDRPDTRLLVRYSPGEPDHILGWLLHADVPGVPTVHFLYARKNERHQGIATALLAAIGVQRDSVLVCTGAGPMSNILRVKYPRVAPMSLAKFLGESAVGSKLIHPK